MPVSSSFDDHSAAGKGILDSREPGQKQGAVASSRDQTVSQAHLPRHVQSFEQGHWTFSGCGVFSWSVFRLYRASLFVQGSVDSGRPFALQLSYLRKVTAQQIADTSVQEFRRLELGSAEQQQQWGRVLLSLLPDVAMGDHLIGLFYPNQKVEFFDGSRHLGTVDDPAFAQAFAAIWLDPRTKGQALRKALLGLTHD